MTRGKSLTMTMVMMIKMMMVMMFIIESYTLSFFSFKLCIDLNKRCSYCGGSTWSYLSFNFLHVFSACIFFKNQAHHNCSSLYIYYSYILYVCPTFSISQPILSRYARRNIRRWFSESIYIGY